MCYFAYIIHCSCLLLCGVILLHLTDPVYKRQKKLVRIISSQPAHSHSAPIVKSLELLRLSDVFQLKLLTFVFETANRISPSCFDDFFLLNSSVQPCNVG